MPKIHPTVTELPTSEIKKDIRDVEKKIKKKQSEIKKVKSQQKKVAGRRKKSVVKEKIDSDILNDLRNRIRERENMAERIDMELLDLQEDLRVRLVLENKGKKHRAKLVSDEKKKKRKFSVKKKKGN